MFIHFKDSTAKQNKFVCCVESNSHSLTIICVSTSCKGQVCDVLYFSYCEKNKKSIFVASCIIELITFSSIISLIGLEFTLNPTLAPLACVLQASASLCPLHILQFLIVFRQMVQVVCGCTCQSEHANNHAALMASSFSSSLLFCLVQT